MYHVLGKDTIHQEDYFDLLNAAEVGMKITYSPDTAEDTTDELYHIVQ